MNLLDQLSGIDSNEKKGAKLFNYLTEKRDFEETETLESITEEFFYPNSNPITIIRDYEGDLNCEYETLEVYRLQTILTTIHQLLF